MDLPQFRIEIQKTLQGIDRSIDLEQHYCKYLRSGMAREYHNSLNLQRENEA
jgi:hypothetical protein